MNKLTERKSTASLHATYSLLNSTTSRGIKSKESLTHVLYKRLKESKLLLYYGAFLGLKVRYRVIKSKSKKSKSRKVIKLFSHVIHLKLRSLKYIKKN